MTKEQFLDAVNEIDDEFINELIDIPDSSRDNYFADDKPQVVYLTSERIPFWKIAVSTAAAVCVLTVGIFAAMKLHGIQSYNPNESAISESSAEVSDSKPTTSKYLDFSERESDCVPFEISISEGDSRSVVDTDAVTKKDNEQYATVQLDCTGVTSLAVFCNGECISRQPIELEGVQTVYIDYFKQAEIGEEFVLRIWTHNRVLVDGKWIP